jgi:large subunit ribosomal protein L13
MIIYDAKDAILGRIGTRIAKSAILGEDVIVVNTAYAVISGGKKSILAEYLNKFKRGTYAHGPFYPKVPSRLFKRLIRGMVPYKTGDGKKAYSRIKCYSGVPKSFEGKDFIIVKDALLTKLPKREYQSIADICKLLGGKQ